MSATIFSLLSTLKQISSAIYIFYNFFQLIAKTVFIFLVDIFGSTVLHNHLRKLLHRTLLSFPKCL